MDFIVNQFSNQLPNGKYGIESLKKAVTATNNIFDLINVTYNDDKKVNQDDLVDFIALGPNAVQSVVQAVNARQDMDEELFDLSENEKIQLVQLAGGRANKPGYQKILKGILEIIDGASELKNPENPTA